MSCLTQVLPGYPAAQSVSALTGAFVRVHASVQCGLTSHTQHVRREGPHLLSRNAVGGAARLVSNFGNDRSACGIRKEGETSPCSLPFGLLGLLFSFSLFSPLRAVSRLSPVVRREDYHTPSPSHVGGPELPNLVHQQRRLWASWGHRWVRFSLFASPSCSFARDTRLSSSCGADTVTCRPSSRHLSPGSLAEFIALSQLGSPSWAALWLKVTGTTSTL